MANIEKLKELISDKKDVKIEEIIQLAGILEVSEADLIDFINTTDIPINEKIQGLLEYNSLGTLEVADKISDMNGINRSRQNVLQKLKRETIRYIDAEEILAAAGYELIIRKREE